RIHGRWEIRTEHRHSFPYLVGAKHDSVMPINVVWGELSGYAPVNLRVAAANEVRSKRKPTGRVADAASSVRAAAPRGVLLCRRCGRPMQSVAEIAPMGRGPGLLAFVCDDCGEAESRLIYPTKRQDHDHPQNKAPEFRIRPSGDGRWYWE